MKFTLSRFSNLRFSFFYLIPVFAVVTADGQSAAKNIGFVSADTVLVSDTNKLTRTDYLNALDEVFETQNKVPALVSNYTENHSKTAKQLSGQDSTIRLIRLRLSDAKDRTVNLQNLQMFETLLSVMQENIKDSKESLLKEQTELRELKRELLARRNDSVIHILYNNRDLRNSYFAQLINIRDRWKVTDSLVENFNTTLNNLKAHNTANYLDIDELSYKVKKMLSDASLHAFVKEKKYLWEMVNNKEMMNMTGYEQKLNIEQKIAAFYFSNKSSNRSLLIFISVVFFFWIYFNFRSLKKLNRNDAIQSFGFTFIGPFPFAASLLFLLSLAPLMDLDAPVIYIEILELLTILLLSIYLYKRIRLRLFLLWCGFVLLFFYIPVFRFLGMGLSGYYERRFLLGFNILSICYAIFAFIAGRKISSKKTSIRLSGILFIVLNVLSIISNCMGRVTMAHIFNDTACYSFVQAVVLNVLVRIIQESFLLQIRSSRIRKKYDETFEPESVSNGVFRLAAFLGLVSWLILFTDNLNVLDTITEIVSTFLAHVYTIGSFNFSLGGLALFIVIIWIANFLQKNIAFFFGETGDDISLENKVERSRLLTTRLILLIAGFLLAIAASGLPVDRITIILGALSVGIGLGLQNIVNNFVSGVILIFDRTLHIGDFVQVDSSKGRVKEIGIRTSTMITDQGAEIIIPNGDLISRSVVNWTLSSDHIRMDISFKVQKPFNLEAITNICLQELAANEQVFQDKKPELLITGLDNDSATLKLYFWCKSISRTERTFSEVYTAIYNSLEAQSVKLL